jgi:hypothetical protein
MHILMKNCQIPIGGAAGIWTSVNMETSPANSPSFFSFYLIVFYFIKFRLQEQKGVIMLDPYWLIW